MRPTSDDSGIGSNESHDITQKTPGRSVMIQEEPEVIIQKEDTQTLYVEISPGPHLQPLQHRQTEQFGGVHETVECEPHDGGTDDVTGKQSSSRP